MGDFLTKKYCLWIDFRRGTDNVLHGSGTSLQNTSYGVTLHIEKAADGKVPIKCYVYLVQDAQLNIVNGRFQSVDY